MTALEMFAHQLAGHEPVADDARELVELHLMDTIAAWIASMGSAEGLLLLKFRAAMRESARPDGARALDLSTRCALARSSEIDDIHLASITTPGGVVIPAALTLAATAPTTTVEDLTAAILAGYEAMTRLGRALDGPSILYRGIWPTYFAAPFAVAAVAGRIFNFEARETANALGLALTLSAPGVGAHHSETTARWFAIGEAATKGLTAALAAQQGFTCDLDLLAGNFFPQIYGINPQVRALTDGLGRQSTLTEVSFKPWCAARQTMAATQALLEIIESGIPPQSIDSIRAFVLPPHRKMIDHGVQAGDRASHLTSVQYQMAAAALGEPPTGALARVAAFMQKITAEPDETLLAPYPRSWPARVAVTAGSAHYERTVTDIPGDPALPFDRARVRDKFMRFVAPVIGKQSTRILDACTDAFAGGNFAALVETVERLGTEKLARAKTP
jgi:2-methylcitrate dehydratase PrpD